MVPIFADHGEGLQVLHYEAGQKYEPHFDYFLDKFNTKNGGQRIATILMYLYASKSFSPLIWIHEKGQTIFLFVVLMLKRVVKPFSLMLK